MNVLISGGSRGIGRAMTELFSERGDRVVFLYKNSYDEAMELCERTGAVAIRCDISDPKDVSETVAKATEILGSVDVLINNAGICEFCFFDSISDEQWKRMIDTNLSGAFYLSREVSKQMIASKSGRIINVGSMWGKVGSSCEVHYSAAKAGLRGMTMALAKELGKSGITVNCIEPGIIDTQMNEKLSDADIAELCDDTPLGRIGQPREVAYLARFLASDEASFITGQLIGIDGGFAI